MVINDALLKKPGISSSSRESSLKELTSGQRNSLFKILETIEVLEKHRFEDQAIAMINHYYDRLEAYNALGYNIRPYLYYKELLKN